MPGPGNYEDSSKTFGKDARTVTILGKPEELRQDSTPGPGIYDPNASVGRY